MTHLALNDEHEGDGKVSLVSERLKYNGGEKKKTTMQWVINNTQKDNIFCLPLLSISVFVRLGKYWCSYSCFLHSFCTFSSVDKAKLADDKTMGFAVAAFLLLLSFDFSASLSFFSSSCVSYMPKTS